MAFAVTGSAFNERIVIRDAGLLRSARDAVFIGDEGDDGFAGAVRRYPRGGNACNSLLYFEAVLSENAGDVTRRFEFLKAELTVAEDLVDHLLGEGLKLVGFLDGFVFEGVERRSLLGGENRRNQEKGDDGRALIH